MNRTIAALALCLAAGNAWAADCRTSPAFQTCIGTTAPTGWQDDAPHPPIGAPGCGPGSTPEHCDLPVLTDHGLTNWEPRCSEAPAGYVGPCIDDRPAVISVPPTPSGLDRAMAICKEHYAGDDFKQQCTEVVGRFHERENAKAAVKNAADHEFLTKFLEGK